MTVTINSVTSVRSCGHITFSGTAAGKVFTLELHRNDFALEPEDFQVAFIARLRAAVREGSITTTLAGLRNALEGRTFKL